LGVTNPVAVVPNGLDLKNVHAVKTEYGTRKIVFLSRLHPKKGIELLLDAWNKLETVGWVMEIAGEGSPDYVKSLKNRIEQSEQNNVRLVGSKYGEAKWEFLRSADLLVLPSYSENFGIVVAEALAVGVPVITTQDTPWQELEAEKCGWWIDLSLETLVAAMLEAMKLRANDLEMMGERGRVLIENNYAIESVGLKINQLYSWISKGGEKPSFVYLAK
jgi:glycosyltransferase involved in cell wall biosynthesis